MSSEDITKSSSENIAEVGENVEDLSSKVEPPQSPVVDAAVEKIEIRAEDTECEKNEETIDPVAEMIADGLSQLGISADGTLQVYLSLFLPGCGLEDIYPLAEYEHLQTVVLSHNSLTDLTPLGSMSSLLTLDVSHNKLTTLLDFKPPFGLREVNFSYNDIESLPDLSAHHCITKLNIDYNHILEIQGLSGCHKLTHLSIMHNKIEKIANLDNLPLKMLNLSHNCIKKIENLETLKFLQIINLAGNGIRSLKGLQGHPLLQEIDLSDNQIIDIAEIRYIRELRLLRILSLLGNPIVEMPDYRLSLLFRIQTLTELDRCKVTAEEKISAVNMFNPPAEVVAARDHMFHVVRSLLQPTRIFDSTLPSLETPYPMLILCGPSGSGKRHLARRLCQEFPDFFGYGVSHTSRPPRAKEENGKDYHFVSQEQFEQDVLTGKFLETSQMSGHLYGITRDAVESVAREGLAAVFHMELEGVLSLKNSYFEPRYVLIIPVTRECHENHLRESGFYSESQITHALDRAETYLKQNRENPGFFDMVINSDDLNEGYKRLKRLIMEYLGMSPPPTTESDMLSCSGTSLESLETIPNDVNAANTSNTTSVTVNVTARTWSRRSGSSTRLSGQKAGQNTAERTPVEQLSMERRQKLVRAAVAGKHFVTIEDLINLRNAASAGANTTSTRLSPDYKRAASLPIDFNASLISMVANASSQNEAKERVVESNASETEDESEATSSLMSSARAYSGRLQAQSPSVNASAEDASEQSEDLVEIDVQGSQLSDSFTFSAAAFGMNQDPSANSI